MRSPAPPRSTRASPASGSRPKPACTTTGTGTMIRPSAGTRSPTRWGLSMGQVCMGMRGAPQSAVDPEGLASKLPPGWQVHPGGKTLPPGTVEPPDNSFGKWAARKIKDCIEWIRPLPPPDPCVKEATELEEIKRNWTKKLYWGRRESGRSAIGCAAAIYQRADCRAQPAMPSICFKAIVAWIDFRVP